MVDSEASPTTGPLVAGRRSVMKTAAWSLPVIAMATFSVSGADAPNLGSTRGGTSSDAANT
ncbi:MULTISPECIES: hypothetical protein [unclassified Microbacterium]|uniref:hypothetical protein n=1 Tax=unclassified Microbacterium TaxID=2609290 RepID=UPI00301009AA